MVDLLVLGVVGRGRFPRFDHCRSYGVYSSDVFCSDSDCLRCKERKFMASIDTPAIPLLCDGRLCTQVVCVTIV